MKKLLKEDFDLIEKAKQIIHKNYDKKNNNHTVGAALRCKNGNIYVGVNVYTLHGACAEMIALGNAITNGEREFDCIVAVRLYDGDKVLSPCGNCRQLLIDYMSNCDVIISADTELVKVEAKSLLPHAYQVEY